MTAKSVLNSSACISTMLRNVPVVVTGIHMENAGLCLHQRKRKCHSARNMEQGTFLRTRLHKMTRTEHETPEPKREFFTAQHSGHWRHGCVEHNIYMKDCHGKTLPESGRCIRVPCRTPEENKRSVSAFLREGIASPSEERN